ncbi:MAG: hypothetical protein WB474_00530 [Nitrososphaeraceae archaeon]
MNTESKIRDTIPLNPPRHARLRIDSMIFNNDGEKLVLNNPVFYIDSVHKEENNTMMTFSGNKVIFNDLEKVILEVEQSSRSSLEKEEIKKILREFIGEIQSKPLDSIISCLKNKFKPYFHIASPYLQMLFSYFLRT